MKKNLFCMLFACFSFFAFANVGVSQDWGVQSKWPHQNLQSPDRDLVEDIYDYRLQFAFPARTCYVLEEYSMDWELLYTYKHDTLETAEAQKEFLETRMALHYVIVEVELPQTWFTYDIYDLRGDAMQDAWGLESLGFDTRIQRILQFTKTK